MSESLVHYRSISRRAVLRGCAALAMSSVLAVAAPSWAGHYVDRCILLVRQATSEADYLQYRLGNRELARVVHEMAEARVRAARGMSVPAEVTQAHPHLLLMLESYERAASAAVQGEAERFVMHLARARDEEQLFRSVMRQLGFPLPDDKKR